MPMKPYVIKQGDYLLKLAHMRGFVADTVWNDGKNAKLKELRKNPNMLQAGDVLFVPDEPRKKLRLNKEETNVYVARVPTVTVSIVVSDDGEPLKDAKYVLEGMGDDTELKTDGEGTATFEAPVHVREVVLAFVDRKLRLKVGIGDLDPADTEAGARMRLTSLGYYGGQLEGEERYVADDEKKLAAALRAFQSDHDLEPTGELDDATKDKLVEVHGS